MLGETANMAGRLGSVWKGLFFFVWFCALEGEELLRLDLRFTRRSKLAKRFGRKPRTGPEETRSKPSFS